MGLENSSGQTKSLDKLYCRLIKPEVFAANDLATNPNQVAGHTGFYSTRSHTELCLKPFNIECVRGRREHLFYQLVEYFNRYDEEVVLREAPATSELHPALTGDESPIYYRDLALLTYPIPAAQCNCIVDRGLFKSLAAFVARFHHSRHLCGPLDSNPFATDPGLRHYLDSVYSDNLQCPCYGDNPKKKSSCSTDYEKVDFLCLDDLTVHCRQPCIVDIKIGQITYDPMAIKEKVAEQSNKYKMLKEFGFRILGMKLVNETKDKNFGKTLETIDQVFQALHGFFVPLRKSHYRHAVIEQVVKGLHNLYEWFESKNINQLKFFSSSILIVYDSCIDSLQHDESILAYLISSVRVKMIDFAHVFHVHIKELSNDKDSNYMFGLKKLEQMFVGLLSQYPTQGDSLVACDDE